jgi:hypothetical protein
LPVRRLTLMAPAIDDNCLNTEFQAAAAKVGTISVLASKKDEVLSAAFPLGNFFAGIIAAGHPWWRAALGHCGPAKPWPANFQPPFEIPDNWKFEHGELPANRQAAARELCRFPSMCRPKARRRPNWMQDGKAVQGWQEAFSSAFASTRFR